MKIIIPKGYKNKALFWFSKSRKCKNQMEALNAFWKKAVSW
jgi:hypothetical protein